MRFALTEEQQQLAGTVRAVLARHSDSAAVRRAAASKKGYDERLWSLLCEQVGVSGLAVPEKYGGAGCSLVETHVALEELGAALTPSPLLGSGVLAAQALLLCGDRAACHELLPGIVDSGTVAALVWAGQDGPWSTTTAGVTATEHAGRWRLGGSGCLVLDGDTADLLLVAANTREGIGLFLADPGGSGVHRRRTPAMDPTLRFATVSFDDAAATLVHAGFGAVLPTLRDIACTAVSALQVGAAQRCLDMTVGYAKERVQFGRPIGSFQALKHRMADMLVLVETARTASWAAAWAASRRDPDLPVRAATAKAWCSEALSAVASEAVQMHGGVAITWEHDAQLYFKRAHALSQLFGQAHEHRRRLFDLFGLAG
jgi:alkylation response protein AidB-like acyl-CoA dehydrogenase